MTIGEYIRTYAPKYRGHTPGHKGFLDPRDVTEIGDEFPAGLIAQSERAAAAVYGARAVRFLVGGSSAGIKASVLALGEDFVTDGYCHPSVTEAAELAGVECYLLPTRTDARTGLPELTTAETLVNEMRNRGVRNAVVQYPDYYGRTPDLARMYVAVRSMGGKLICDGAHGAHFVLRPDLFPPNAAGHSDVCNLSAHKTLCAMTQTAYLAVGGRFDEKAIDDKLRLLGTTSPNYILLASLETALGEGLARRGDYDRLKAFADGFRSKFPCLKNDDFTRLVLDCGKGNGKWVAKRLRECGVVAEKSDDRYVVFILTPFDTDEGLRALERGAEEALGGNR